MRAQPGSYFPGPFGMQELAGRAEGDATSTRLRVRQLHLERSPPRGGSEACLRAGAYVPRSTPAPGSSKSETGELSSVTGQLRFQLLCPKRPDVEARGFARR